MKDLVNLPRFTSKVQKIGDCHIWTGARSKGGYGQTSLKNVVLYAHRVAYIAAKGDIPSGMQIDHLCRNRACCNPDHLEVVTPAENTRRGAISGLNTARSMAQTHCKRGHKFEDGSYRVYNGCRSCKECARILRRKRSRVLMEQLDTNTRNSGEK